MISLHPKIQRALITGGSRGIGLAIARRLMDQGVEVYYASRQPSAFEHSLLHHLAADFSNPRESMGAISESFQGMERVPDVLVCAAGTLHEALVLRQEDASMEEQLRVNMTFHMHLIRWIVAPMLLRRFGRIVGISSTAARFPAPGQAVYASAKAGLEAFLKGCAVEFARKGITCNWVTPGYVRTDFSSEFLAQKDLKKVVPVGRAGTSEEVAEAVMLFLGEYSDYLTGSQIVVDGGLSLAVK
ncbi:SDR family NAD(P)-dependent oxidoreductase [Desulforhabdus amnigena]|jgi:3-oxoacyl-[acyl-carrier protein] reductase|uniref:Beta-ketoacyl-ACP reductase n=1 Tax=Desulforhabdus amnigena TaxID=40218 RepID=A0A9W6CY49_9BACT|nr:SDR family oxidoreductase [Desulforhabdus amnigena]NLJ29922.1 SDR family oxidoreductase [Deltaproteobacteria bacterium]GLI33961.1 beta-ketoacyl-ACP reductase [Desulforhabdus amnigena]